MSFKTALKKSWAFLKADSWQSWIVSLVLIVVLIKFIFFPTLSFLTGTPLPLVVVESCSMYHETNFDSWWSKNEGWYQSKNISKSQFQSFSFENGLNKGDIIFVLGVHSPKLGDIIIFQPNPDSYALHPIIHRTISLSPIETKGDHNSAQLSKTNNPENIDETNIPPEKIIGKAVFKIPLLGWIKLIFFEPLKAPPQRGFCQ